MPEPFTIDVYRDDPIWDCGKRWFQLPLHELARLFVARYEIQGESVCVADVHRHAAELRAQHPDCVFVHI